MNLESIFYRKEGEDSIALTLKIDGATQKVVMDNGTALMMATALLRILPPISSEYLNYLIQLGKPLEVADVKHSLK